MILHVLEVSQVALLHTASVGDILALGVDAAQVYRLPVSLGLKVRVRESSIE